MSDSDTSGDEDLTRFKEAVDVSFTKLIKESRDGPTGGTEITDVSKAKSERYLEVSSHYNDVKVPAVMQERIGAKVAGIISKTVEFVDAPNRGAKKCKIKGGVKLFSTSVEYLSCEAPKDLYTDTHNEMAKKLKSSRRIPESDNLDDNDKVKQVAVSGEYILSKEDTKCWKSRRKEKVLKYKQGKGKALIAVE